jgi:hypothetical protein
MTKTTSLWQTCLFSPCGHKLDANSSIAVFEFWFLEFICYLGFVFWNLIFLYTAAPNIKGN